MSPAFLVATILAVGWNLMLVIAAVITGTGPFGTGASERRTMRRTFREVQAEVGRPEFDARSNAWRREGSGGTAEFVHSRVTETPRKMNLTAPYAEASVAVATDGEEQLRRCSVCVN